jgi:hypothetical protein
MKKKLLTLTILFGNFFLMNSQNNCSSALPVTAGVTTVGTINGTLVDGCGQTNFAASAEWYVYNSTISGIVTITSDLTQNDGTTNSDDTYLNVYSGTCAALSCVGYNDDTTTNYLSTLSFLVEPGESYYIEWSDEWSDDGFDFELTEIEANCSGTATPPFTENFTDVTSVYFCWELLDEDSDGYGWEQVDYDGNPCAKSASYDNDTYSALTPDNWLISYPIDLTSFSSSTTIELSWLARGIDASYADENYSVYVASSNSTTNLLASSTTFTEIIGQNGGAGVYASRTLDISSFYGQIIYVAFRHHNSTDEYELNIDDVAVSTTLSAQDFANNSFNVYPSPANNVINISSDNLLTVKAIKIIDVNGRLVKQVEGIDLANTEINVSDLTSGVYLMTIESTEGSVVKKFIKQ